MKNISSLTNFYYEVLYPTLEKLEKDRKVVKHRILVVGVIYSTVFLLIFIYSTTSASFLDPIFVEFAYVFFGTILYKSIVKNYTVEFKQNVIGPLIHAIDDRLSYEPSLHISESFFIRSDLFSKPDKIEGNDYVQGRIDGIDIEFSDLHAKKSYKDHRGRTVWETIFRGLFIVAEFNKNFSGKTIVLPDTAQNAFGDLVGGWLQSNNVGRDELVRMDNNDFEKQFVVYSTDQIEARYILSHSLMKKLLLLREKSQHKVYISFAKSHIHLAIYYGKDLFEPSVFHSLLEHKVAMEYVKTLHLAIGIIDDLKLNQKLWSKQ